MHAAAALVNLFVFVVATAQLLALLLLLPFDAVDAVVQFVAGDASDAARAEGMWGEKCVAAVAASLLLLSCCYC